MSCLFGEPLRPCGGAAGAQSAHKAGAFGPGFGLAGGGLRPPAAKRRRPPPGRPGYPSPRVQRRGMGGAAQPIPAPSPWACRVPLRLAAAAAASRFRQGCGNRCGPAGGGGGGAKRPQSRGLWPRLWFGRPGGRRPPAAKRRRPPPQGVLPPTKAWANEKGLGTEAFVAFTNAPNSSAVRGNRGLGSLCS